MFVFFFNDTATTEIYTLSLHDALPICAHLAHQHPDRPAVRDGVMEVEQEVVALPGQAHEESREQRPALQVEAPARQLPLQALDRKSTRLNSSHANISYAVFCLKKKLVL